MSDSGDSAATATTRIAVELLRLAAIYGRRHESASWGAAMPPLPLTTPDAIPAREELDLALEQAYDALDGEVATLPLHGDALENVSFAVSTVQWDPKCQIVADGLAKLEIPFSREIGDGEVIFAVAPECARPALALLDSLCDNVHGFSARRISNLDALKAAAGESYDVPARIPFNRAIASDMPSAHDKENVWSGVCETPEQAALVHAALDRHGIDHYGEIDPETGSEEIFIAQSELEAKGYRLPRAAKDVPELSLAVEGGDATLKRAKAIAINPNPEREARRAARQRPASIDRDLQEARRQSEALSMDEMTRKTTRTRSI